MPEAPRDPDPMKILVLPGDGIGPEITAATLQVLRAADAALSCGLGFERRDIGLASLRAEGTTLPKAVLERVPEVDGVLLGPVSHLDYPPRQEGGLNPSAELRTRFELYANIRPCRSREGLTLLRKPMDLVIVRENTEGFYADRNMFAGSGEFVPDARHGALASARSRRRARAGSRRRRFGSRSRRRRKVTAVHKANVLKLTDGLFLRETRKVAAEFPDVELEELIVDATAALLIRNPDRFDVIVTTNMFGDILSDEASELSGSLGLGGSINAGERHLRGAGAARLGSRHRGPGHGQPDLADPVAAMLLAWRGRKDGKPALERAASLIEAAIDHVLARPKLRTADLGGSLSTDGFARAVAEAVARLQAAKAGRATSDAVRAR